MEFKEIALTLYEVAGNSLQNVVLFFFKYLVVQFTKCLLLLFQILGCAAYKNVFFFTLITELLLLQILNCAVLGFISANF